MANKRGEELETARGALKQVEEGRQKAEVEAAGLRVVLEALRRRREDLQRRLGVAEAQVRGLTSTLIATYSAHPNSINNLQAVGPPGVQSQVSGSKSGSQ